MMIEVTSKIRLDERELRFRFVRASGPGGQNVNKVATAVELRFDAARSEALPPPVRRRLLALAGRRAGADGTIVISARRFRTQEANRRDAVERLTALLRRAARAPRQRIPTKPSAASKRRRLDRKRRRGETKRLRAPLRGDEGG